jgi:xanthine dehydrogenase accessory factor
MTERCGIVDILALPETGLPVVRVVVARIDGSTPREAGAAMLVTNAAEKQEPSLGGGVVGTIGGGQLEFEAIAHARTMLAEHGTPWLRDLRIWPLGPSLGQCCGGVVRLLFERYGEAECAQMRNALAASSASIIIRPVSSGEQIRMLTTRQDARDLPLHIARVAGDMLSGARPRQAAFIPARKEVGACFVEPTRASAKPLFVYGAGHVGRVPTASAWCSSISRCSRR